MIKDREQTQEEHWSDGEVQPPLPDYAREDHIEVLEFYNVGEAVIDKCKVVFPILPLYDTQESL